MNRKNIFFFFFILLFGSSVGICQHDSIILKRIRVSPDTVIAGIHGIGITYIANLGYDILFHLKKSPSVIKMVFTLSSNHKSVECYGSSYKFCKNDSFCYTNDLSFGLSRQETVLIPFYTLKLPEGNNSVTLVLNGLLGDTSILESA